MGKTRCKRQKQLAYYTTKHQLVGSLHIGHIPLQCMSSMLNQASLLQRPNHPLPSQDPQRTLRLPMINPKPCVCTTDRFISISFAFEQIPTQVRSFDVL